MLPLSAKANLPCLPAALFDDPDLAYTVFAPINEAFEDAAASFNITLADFTASPELLLVLENHLLAYPLTVRSWKLH